MEQRGWRATDGREIGYRAHVAHDGRLPVAKLDAVVELMHGDSP